MAEEKCPVDHKTRDAWLAQARQQSQSSPSSPSSPPAPSSNPVDHPTSVPSQSWSRTINSYLPWLGSRSPPDPGNDSALGTTRVTSTIPRTDTSTSSSPIPHGASANAETAAAPDSSGHWVYPSEKMFFDAMRRKGYSPEETDMKTVVPIHNAVNERAWKEICDWEAPYLAHTPCDSPKLSSFANKAERMTPKARINTILGYTAPFDRHDWVVDRCGKRVDYVIDFYAGRPGGASGKGPSFYLDVRPKLNTWEGWKMRAAKWTGLA